MRFKSLLVASIFIASSMAASAGSVSSMTSEQTVKGPDGSNYVQSSVKCAGNNLVPSIWRPEAGGDWCGVEVAGFCSSKKMSAAKKVCGRGYTAKLRDLPPQAGAVAAPAAAPVAEQPVAAPVEAPVAAPAPVEPAPAPVADSATTASQDQLDIERERLKIEQQRLELRKQQVELQKEELEIKQQMEVEKASSAAKPQQPAPQPVEDASSAPKKSVLGM